VELTNEFRVPVPIDDAWRVLTDVERIAPCMPGADLQEIEGDEYRGVVKVKVGPITAQYKGKATFQEKDDAAHRAVLKAEGRDTRGQGNANATITALLRPDGDGTAVSITTDLHLTGKVAQFGRGVLADVSGKLLKQFVDCLEADVLGPARAGGGTTPPPAGDQAQVEGQTTAIPTSPSPVPPAAQADQSGPTVRKIETTRDVAPVDLLETAGAPVAKRVAPLVAVLFVLGLLLRRRRRRRKGA
jgi:carbon monoxide dehydrogenase subunit G